MVFLQPARYRHGRRLRFQRGADTHSGVIAMGRGALFSFEIFARSQWYYFFAPSQHPGMTTVQIYGFSEIKKDCDTIKYPLYSCKITIFFFVKLFRKKFIYLFTILVFYNMC